MVGTCSKLKGTTKMGRRIGPKRNKNGVFRRQCMKQKRESTHTKKLCELNVSRRASGRGRRNVITWPIRSSDKSESLVIDGVQMSWLQAVDTDCAQ